MRIERNRFGRKSWIHQIYCKDDFEKLDKFTQLEEYKYMLVAVGLVLIEGEVRLAERSMGTLGKKGKKSLMVLTQSGGSWIIEELISKNVIENWQMIISLDSLHADEIEYTSKGGRIKKATYLFYEGFLEHLGKMEDSLDYNYRAANIYVPIGYSNVRDVIPPGENIIYSTLAQGRGYYFGGTEEVTNYKWVSHILLTEEGMAFTIPTDVSHTKKQVIELNPREEHYLPWHNFNIYRSRKHGPCFVIEKIENELKLEKTNLNLLATPEIETEDSFNQRRNLFYEKFNPIQEQKKKIVQDKVYHFLKENPYYRPLKVPFTKNFLVRNPGYSLFDKEKQKEILEKFSINERFFCEVFDTISRCPTLFYWDFKERPQIQGMLSHGESCSCSGKIFQFDTRSDDFLFVVGADNIEEVKDFLKEAYPEDEWDEYYIQEFDEEDLINYFAPYNDY